MAQSDDDEYFYGSNALAADHTPSQPSEPLLRTDSSRCAPQTTSEPTLNEPPGAGRESTEGGPLSLSQAHDQIAGQSPLQVPTGNYGTSQVALQTAPHQTFCHDGKQEVTSDMQPTTFLKALDNNETLENQRPLASASVTLTQLGTIEDADGGLQEKSDLVMNDSSPCNISSVLPAHIDEVEAALVRPTVGSAIADPIQETAPQEGPEFEADSSPYESSSESSSDSSSDDDSDDDYPLLDAQEQARLLMEEGGSDDEGGKKGGAAGAPRTQNEQIDEIVEMPDIQITAEMKIEELGTVAIVVDNIALIKARTSAEHQVLEGSSLLCRADRKVIGVVAETIGRVEEPMYVVRFTNPSTLAEFEIEVGTPIFFVPSHSRFVFTKALQVKGSDASNLHDEEVGDYEMDFSDDEAEQAYKSSLKKAKQARRDANRGPTGDMSRRLPQVGVKDSRSHHQQPASTPMELSYDDNGGDDLYTPLARPTNLADMMRHAAPGEEQDQAGRFMHGNPRDGRPFRARGRGDRGRGRGGGRGDFTARGRGRGSKHVSDSSRGQQYVQVPAGSWQPGFSPRSIQQGYPASSSTDLADQHSSIQGTYNHSTPHQITPPPMSAYGYPVQMQGAYSAPWPPQTLPAQPVGSLASGPNPGQYYTAGQFTHPGAPGENGTGPGVPDQTPYR